MTLDRLKESLDEAEWAWLKTHSQRDAVIVVHTSLDLLLVGQAIANDSSQQVNSWIQKGLLTKPTQKQIEEWDSTPNKRFMCLVIQPYVLIQDIAFH
jgi:hypothetical protein